MNLAEESKGVGSTTKQLGILIVESNRADVVLTQYALKKAKILHVLESITSGEGAVRVLQNRLEQNSSAQLPDIVILDTKLPDNIKLLQFLEENEIFQSTGLIVISDSDQPEEIEGFEILKNIDKVQFLSRPMNKDKLLEAFHCLIEDLDILEAEDTNEFEYLFNRKPGKQEDSLDLNSITEEIPHDDQMKKVLLIEDNQADAKLIEKRLTREQPGQFYVIHRRTLKEAVEFMKSNYVDVVTVDLGLPDAFGLDVFEAVQKADVEVPIVVLTGVDDSTYAMEAMKMGAQDYIVKDISRYGEVLGRILKYAIERKKVERLIRHSLKVEQNALRVIMDEAPLFVIRLDTNLRVKSVNPAFARKCKMSQEEIVSKSIFDIMPNLGRDQLEMVVIDGVAASMQQELIASLGKNVFENLYLDISIWPTQNIIDKDKREAVIICNDVSDQVVFAKQREEFIATLAHDIRNPLIGESRVLTAIIESARELLPPAVKSALESISKSNNSLLLMLSNMVEVYKLESSGSTLHLSNIDLTSFAESIVNEMDYLTYGSNISIKFEDIDENTVIEGDELALKRVIQNLVCNAVKYSNKDSEILVSVSRDDTESVVLRVFNTGSVISEAERGVLFERFVKASQGRKNANSSGLGLYLCKKIVEGHGGIIGCTSDESGTTFIATFPAVKIESSVTL